MWTQSTYTNFQSRSGQSWKALLQTWYFLGQNNLILQTVPLVFIKSIYFFISFYFREHLKEILWIWMWFPSYLGHIVMLNLLQCNSSTDSLKMTHLKQRVAEMKAAAGMFLPSTQLDRQFKYPYTCSFWCVFF